MFKKLKGCMFENDLTQKMLAEIIGRSETYITNRMTGHYPWTLDDVYDICKALGIPSEEICVYFPKGGRAS